jgi:hypothetical protein
VLVSLAIMPETPAQKAARERNLRKGNPSAYSRTAQGEPPEDPPETPRPAPGRSQGPAQGARTFRAKSAPRKTRKPPRAKAAAPRGPTEDPPGPAKEKSPGFLGGLLEGLGG